MKKYLPYIIGAVVVIFIIGGGFYFSQPQVGATKLFPYQGGTGTSSAPTYGQMLVGTSGGVYQLQATSTLGITASMGALNELSDVVITAGAYGDLLMFNGSNWVDQATSTLGIVADSYSAFGTDFFTYFSATTTDYLTQGSSNLYFTGTNFWTYFNATTTDYLTEGSSNLYMTEAGWSGYMAGTTTDALTQGSTNKYMTYPGAGIALSTGSAWDTSITNNSANWNTAYGWGNHASAGYLLGSAYYATTTHPLISSLPSLSITKSQVSDFGTYDPYGQATSSLLSFTTPYYATTTHPNISSLPALSITKSQVSDFGTYESVLTFNYPLTRATNAVSLSGMATSSLTATTPLALSNAISVIGSSASALTCTTAASGVAGCLSNTAFDTFNNKQATISATYPIILTGAALSFPATSTLYGTGAYGQFLMWNTQPAWTATSTLSFTKSQISDLGTLFTQAIASTTFVDRADWTTHDSYPAACTNQFVRTIGDTNTCATVGAADVSLANLSATDTTLTFSGTYTGATARTIGLNLGNANTWTALQTFGNASTTNFSTSYASSTIICLGGSCLTAWPSGTSPLTTKGDIYTYSTTNDRLPIGTNGYVLMATSTASTGLMWVATSSLGISGGGSPGGSNTQIQFNNGGVFGGDSNLTWDNTTKTLGAIKIVSTEIFTAFLGGNPNLTIESGINENITLWQHGTGRIKIFDYENEYNAIFDASLMVSSDKTFTFPNWTGEFLISSSTSLYVATTTGNVGIGTAGPIAQLQVEKSSYTSGQIVINNGQIGAPPTYPDSYTPTLVVAVNETSGSRPLFFGYDTGSAWNAYMNIGACGAFSRMCVNLGAGSTDYTALENVGTTLYVGGGADGNFTNVSFQNSGNVGIGTTTPTEKLHNTGNFRNEGTFRTGVSGEPGRWRFYDSSGYLMSFYTTATDYDTWGLYWDGADNEIRWMGNGSIRASVDLDDGSGYFQGNVGIGTMAVGAKLDIWKTTGGSTDIFHISSTTTGDFVTVNSTGNVGIGTTGPTHKLDVYGNIRAGIAGVNDNLFIVDTATGKVGVGTSTPAMKFSVQGDALADSWNVYSDIYKGDAITALKGIKPEKGKTGDWVSVDHNTLPTGILKNNPITHYENYYEPILTEQVGGMATTTITKYKRISDGVIISEEAYNQLPEEEKSKTNTWTLPTMSISNLAVMNSRAIVQLDERLGLLENIKLGSIGSDGQLDKEQLKREIKDEIKPDIEQMVNEAVNKKFTEMSFWQRIIWLIFGK